MVGERIVIIYHLRLEDGSAESPPHSTLFTPASLQRTVSDGNGNCMGVQAQDPTKTSVWMEDSDLSF